MSYDLHHFASLHVLRDSKTADPDSRLKVELATNVVDQKFFICVNCNSRSDFQNI
jgi:hypothetical protein